MLYETAISIRHIKNIFILSLLLLINQQLLGIILYSGDNEANQSNSTPELQVAFNSVGRLCNSTGGGGYGSAAHIKGKYIVTANHVSTSGGYLTFDGVTLWPLDSSFGTIKIGSTDMKLFKLLEDPQLEETPLYTGTSETTLPRATLIGWGVGRNTTVEDSVSGTTNQWKWGDTGTFAKRWGTNKIDAALYIGAFSGYNYSYDTLRTRLNNDDDNEAAAAVYDSGSGLFVNDNGTWKLAGLTTLVSRSGDSNFSISGDANYFVRISSYASDISVLIPEEQPIVNATSTPSTPTKLEDLQLLTTLRAVQVDGSIYLELVLTRPAGLTDVIYTPQTTNSLATWPSDSSGIVNPNPTAVDNATAQRP